MNKSEITEIKKLFTPRNCSITRICGCYVDGEKNKKTEFKQAFLALPEEEMYKYFELLRKNFSGTLNKNLLNLEFSLSSEGEGTAHEFLLKLRDSRLKDDALLTEFYDKIINSYEYIGNYLILIIHDAYDVPKLTTDGVTNEDASEEVYDYIMACICPVNLSKAGLSYDATGNYFRTRIRDWVVDMPEFGFIFPAFNDRSTDIHALMVYEKNPELNYDSLVDELIGCELPLSAGTQKDVFRSLISETLGNDCGFTQVKQIHEQIQELVEEHSEDALPLILDKEEVKDIFEKSGVSDEKMSVFDERYENNAGEDATLSVNNIVNTRSFDVKTPDVTIKVKPERTDLLSTKEIDGRKCLVIALDGEVEINGISVRP